ncbi:MAG: serine hydroxymethyltransferase [Pseudomonadota bacterium]|nr:serine hydroxymethyltransferase [Pseudomonadota bacterium]
MTLQNSMPISDFDGEIWYAMTNEAQRQEEHVELIASENYVSKAILEAVGSGLTNKYAEGYPGKRYYGGCEHVDEVERLAIERAKTIFGATYANVQPHSGSQANAAAYMAILKPNDTVMGMSLSDGGHLTHGAAVNFSGKIYKAVQYGVEPATGLLDYDRIRELALNCRPKLLVGGFSAYSRVLEWKTLREIADEVDAMLLADVAHVAGLMVADIYPSPIDIADIVTTTTHKTLRGPRSGLILTGERQSLEKSLNSAVFPGLQGGPLMHVVAAKAIAFKEAMEPGFRDYQIQVVENAKGMVEVFKERGYRVVSGGTDNHLFLIDLSDKSITGKTAEFILGQANITVNKKTVPGDTQSPFVTSGIRIGTPAVTTRGFGLKEVQLVANYMCDVLDDPRSRDKQKVTKELIRGLCADFPVYGER